MTNEFALKQEKIHALMDEKHLEAILLKRVSSFAWATCGAASFVNSATTLGDSSLLITKDRSYLLTQNNEAPRLEDEEQLKSQGWEFMVKRWDSDEDPVSLLAGGLRVGSDGEVPGAFNLALEIGRLRANLLPPEQQRMRDLGQLCALSMQEAVAKTKPGMTEFEISAVLSATARSRGVMPIVNLIATDQRIFKYRHPLPTAKKLDKYAMLVMCGRCWGLVISITRLIHFGKIPPELNEKSRAVATIDAGMIHATLPGATLGELFRATLSLYKETGFEEEWKFHHQGGIISYEPREFKAVSDSREVLRAGQGVAWNPSIAGVKSEDTILVGENSQEVLTEIPRWPKCEIQLNGKTFFRPAIKEIL
jgi:antitoxin VapB